jgi:hypothetical protein
MFVPTLASFQFSVIRKNLGFTQFSAKTGKIAISMLRPSPLKTEN